MGRSHLSGDCFIRGTPPTGATGEEKFPLSHAYGEVSGNGLADDRFMQGGIRFPFAGEQGPEADAVFPGIRGDAVVDDFRKGGEQSVCTMISSLRVAGEICPGQRTMKGTRWPPS